MGMPCLGVSFLSVTHCHSIDLFSIILYCTINRHLSRIRETPFGYRSQPPRHKQAGVHRRWLLPDSCVRWKQDVIRIDHATPVDWLGQVVHILRHDQHKPDHGRQRKLALDPVLARGQTLASAS
jgi:hypothetical protein